MRSLLLRVAQLRLQAKCASATFAAVRFALQRARYPLRHAEHAGGRQFHHPVPACVLSFRGLQERPQRTRYRVMPAGLPRIGLRASGAVSTQGQWRSFRRSSRFCGVAWSFVAMLCTHSDACCFRAWGSMHFLDACCAMSQLVAFVRVFLSSILNARCMHVFIVGLVVAFSDLLLALVPGFAS